MARSPEYPDLAWVAPRSWSSGRASGQPTVIVIHTTEGHEKTTSAEDGAAYDARRTDGTSTHYFHDQNSTVQCVRTTDRAHTARANGNRIGIQHELCGRAGQTPEQWADAASEGTLRRAAKQCARDALKWSIPVKKLSVAEVRGGVRGFCGHVDITQAFPQDGGTHTDPGVNFPWVKFLAMVKEFAYPRKDEDMPQVINGKLPLGETVLEVIPPVNQGSAGWGPAWLAIGAEHGDATVRVAVHDTGWRPLFPEGWVRTFGRTEPAGGTTLPDGCTKVSLRFESGSTAETLASFRIEYGSRG